MGLRDIEKKLKVKSAFQVKEAELMIKELEQMLENIKQVKKQLKKFEKKYGDKIVENKEYYEKLAGLREELGLPTEIGRYEWKEAPTLKDRLTGKGFYDVLANEIMDLGQKLIEENGGIMSVGELFTQLNKARPGKLVTIDDLYRSLDKLINSKLIPPFKVLESGVKLVEFAPVEFSPDHDVILNMASRTGFVTKEDLLLRTGWAEERINRCLSFFEESGIARVDSSYAEGTKYYFPGLSHT
ncbi:MAG: EAP30/Vps36 family vacuolar-sorting protein [Candidatus Heimdallarchaeum endolithica]|uniref:EAP30/Vps36 family vacuolar-sorting protein n=1 Tax=Candidatus Heimdallarchaeum endolithica TaxID=2876572 RepID=A0A9Y1BQ02_9ARCH|nr:MAG: EAP30/Vps36 family vacuolar-sorting protein [Candidatus Heimdallarchaeum endolithica]